MAKSLEDSGLKSPSVTEMGPNDKSTSYDETQGEVHDVDHLSLQRQLKSRHITMIGKFPVYILPLAQLLTVSLL